MDDSQEQHFVVMNTKIADTLSISTYRQVIANLSEKKPIDISTILINGICHTSETTVSENARLASRLGYVTTGLNNVPKEVQYKALNRKPTHLRLVK